RWANDNGSSVAYKTAVIRDKDGSLGGGANSYVVINVDGVSDTIASDTRACEAKHDWNAVICKDDIGRFSVGGGGFGFGGPRGGAPGAGAPGGAPRGGAPRGGAPGAGP